MSSAKNSQTTIYVSLLDEGIAVRRPILAEHIEGQIYRIAAQPYDRELERWEFEPGDVVLCQPVDTSTGPVIAAVRLAT